MIDWMEDEDVGFYLDGKLVFISAPLPNPTIMATNAFFEATHPRRQREGRQQMRGLNKIIENRRQMDKC